MKKDTLKRLVLATGSGLILSAAWPPYGFSPLLLFAFIPLLWMEEDYQGNSRVRFSFLVYFSFFIWNLLTSWWIYKATLFGAAMAIVCNALFMTAVFLLFHGIKKRWGHITGYTSLIAGWISFEYLHLNWDLSWPWLTLGNGFSSSYKLVQWYEYTGVLGGSAWILIVNILIFQLLRERIRDRRKIHRPLLFCTLVLIFFPMIFSLALYSNYREKPNPVDIIVVQPNIDPYTEKFSGPVDEQMAKLLHLASTQTDSSADYIICPETALPAGIWENNMSEDNNIGIIRQFIRSYPKLKFICGLSSYRLYKKGEQHSVTARRFTRDEGYYDAYNSSMQIDSSPRIQIYHKSKLVPGVEKMPYPALFGFLERYAIDMGGMSGSLGNQNERTVFISPGDPVKIGTAICYESVYGEFFGEYVKKGATLMSIITNDGWWGDTPGYRQHLSYARLRAIETRRSIARSANTGISCFINQRGDISMSTGWWKPAVIRGSLNASDRVTFYARWGDYPGRLSILASIAVLLRIFILKIKRKYDGKI